MKTPIFLSVDDVKYLHKEQIELYGGMDGVRDHGLLVSAVEAPKATFDGKFLLDDIEQMAATYLYNLVQNHPFIDGNKRVGTAACLVFLLRNGYSYTIQDNKLIELVISVASSKLTRDKLATHLKSFK